MLFFNVPAANAAKEALSIWASQVVPVLFPFFVCADMMRLFCGKSLGAFTLFAMSMLSGAPAGARLCKDFNAKSEAQSRLCAALNATGPMFIVGAFCSAMLGCPLMSLPILLGQYASSAVMFFFCRSSVSAAHSEKPETPPLPILQALSDSIYNAVQAMLSIGGTIVCFKVLLAVFARLYALSSLPLPPVYISAMLYGCLEFVSGSVLLSACSLTFREMAASAAFLFSFGGLCVMAQSMRYVKLDAPVYLCRKLLQALISACIAFFSAPLFLPRAGAVFCSVDTELIAQNTLSALGLFAVSSFSLCSLWLLRVLFCNTKKAARK